MKTEIVKYGNGGLREAEGKLSKRNVKLIDEFVLDCGGTAGESTRKKIRRLLIKVADILECDLDRIDSKVLKRFGLVINDTKALQPATKNEIRKTIKRFILETYNADDIEKFKKFKSIKGEKDINQIKINADTILRKEDIELLMRGCKSLKFKALIILMYETAGRPEEILNLKWRDVNLEEGDVKLLGNHTGNLRINPIQSSIPHLKRWKQDYPFLNCSVEDWVFVSSGNRENRIQQSTLSVTFKRLGKSVLGGKHLFPYLIRHSRATYLQKTLPPKVYEKFMDHSIQTATRYSHLDKDDVRKVMFEKVYGIEEISEEKKHKIEIELEEQRTKTKKAMGIILDIKDEMVIMKRDFKKIMEAKNSV